MNNTDNQGTIKNRILDLKNQYKEALDKAYKSISDLELERTDLIYHLEKSNKNSAKLNFQLDALNKKIALLQEQYTQKDEELNNIKLEIDEITKKNKIELNKVIIIANKRKELVESFQEKNNLLNEENEQAKSNIHELTNQNSILTTKNQELKNELDIVVDNILNLEKDNTNLIEKSAELTELNHNLIANLNLANIEKEDLSNKLSKVEENYQLLDSNFSKISVEKNNLASSLLENNLKIQTLENTVYEKTQALLKLTENFNILSNEKNTLLSKDEENLKIIQSINNDLESLKTALKITEDERKTLENKLELIIQDSNEKLNLSNEKLNLKEKELLILISEKDKLEPQIVFLQNQLEQLKNTKLSENENLKKELELLAEENSNLKTSISKKEIEVDIAKQDISSLKNIVENLRNQISKTEKDILESELLKNESKFKLTEKEFIISSQNKEIWELKNNIEELTKSKNKEIERLYGDINSLKEKVIEISKIGTDSPNAESQINSVLEKLIIEKDGYIESLKNENIDLISKVELLSKTINTNTESSNNLLASKQKVTDDLNREIKDLISRNNFIEKQLNDSNTNLNKLSLENKNLLFNTEEYKSKISSYEKEIAKLKSKLDEQENLKVNELKKSDYISIDELYKTTFNNSTVETRQSQEYLDVKNDENIIKEADSNVNFDISHLEFIIEENKESESKEEEKNTSTNYQPPITSSRTNTDHIVKPIDKKSDKNLDYLNAVKKQKTQKMEDTVFILGGNKDIEDKWKSDLEKTLQEYGLTHQWLSNSEKDILRGAGKGIVFIISPSSLQYLENADLILRNTNIPSIKHNLTNLTKLKIEIIDNFIRKKVS